MTDDFDDFEPEGDATDYGDDLDPDDVQQLLDDPDDEVEPTVLGFATAFDDDTDDAGAAWAAFDSGRALRAKGLARDLCVAKLHRDEGMTIAFATKVVDAVIAEERAPRDRAAENAQLYAAIGYEMEQTLSDLRAAGRSMSASEKNKLRDHLRGLITTRRQLIPFVTAAKIDGAPVDGLTDDEVEILERYRRDKVLRERFVTDDGGSSGDPA